MRYFESSLLELLPFSEGHEADKFLRVERNECWIINNTFIKDLESLFKFFLGVFYEAFCQKDGNFGSHFVLFFISFIDFGLNAGPVFFFSVLHTVPDVGHYEEN